MKYFIRIILSIGLFAISQYAYPGSVAETFSNGDTLTADSLNNIKSAVNDNDARITALGSAGGGSSPDFSGFDPGFSPDGAVKNVVVASEPLPSGGTIYHVRYWYASGTETVSIDGVQTQRPFLAGYPEVETDNAGDIVSISNYIETPDTENYVNYNIEESSYDPLSLVKTVSDDSLRESWVCNGGEINICLATDTLTNGTFQTNSVRTLVRALTGPFTVNGMTFDEVRVEYDQGRPDFRTRIRARGIGEIQVNRQGHNPSTLIYYQANGVSGGSLVGTPFEPVVGQLDGLFF
jgi:hypothetical protein